MAYTQASYGAGAGYYPQYNHGLAIPNRGFKTSVKKHTCNFCDYRSDRTYNVRRHVEKVHPEMCGGRFKPGGGSMENTQPSRLYPTGYIERNIHGMINEQNKPGGVIFENTQQPPRFYQNNPVERDHLGMVNTQSRSAGGLLQNMSQPARYIPRVRDELQRYDNENIINQQRSEVNLYHHPYDNSRGDVERNNQRSGGTMQNNGGAAIESSDFRSQKGGQMKYRNYT